MAVTALTNIVIDRSGTIVDAVPTQAAGAGAGNGVTFNNNGATFLKVKWTVTDTLTVAFASGIGAPDGTTNAGKAITLTGGTGSMLIGPFPITLYGSVVSAFAGLATTLVAAVQLTPSY